MKHNSRRNRATFSGSEQDKQTAGARQAQRGRTRRDFMKVAAGAGVALAVAPGRHALAGSEEDWEWVDPNEPYDPEYE